MSRASGLASAPSPRARQRQETPAPIPPGLTPNVPDFGPPHHRHSAAARRPPRFRAGAVRACPSALSVLLANQGSGGSRGGDTLCMAQAQQQSLAAAATIVDGLARRGQIEVGTARDTAVAAVAAAIDTHLAGLAQLDRDAEKLADQHLRAAGRDGLGLDRRKVVQMIRQRIAKERDFPL